MTMTPSPARIAYQIARRAARINGPAPIWQAACVGLTPFCRVADGMVMTQRGRAVAVVVNTTDYAADATSVRPATAADQAAVEAASARIRAARS